MGGEMGSFHSIKHNEKLNKQETLQAMKRELAQRLERGFLMQILHVWPQARFGTQAGAWKANHFSFVNRRERGPKCRRSGIN